MARSFVALVGCVIVLALAGSAVAQDTFTAELDGRSTVPPATTTATGLCTGTLNAEQTEFTFTCTHDVPQAVQGHIHEGPKGISGDVVREFADDNCCPDSTTWTADDEEPLTQELVARLMAGELYVNIHSEQFPTEELRGQFILDSEIVADAPTSSGVCGALVAQAMFATLAGLVCLRFHHHRKRFA